MSSFHASDDSVNASFRFPSAANYLLLTALKNVQDVIAFFGGGWSPVLSFESIIFGLGGARVLPDELVFFSSADVGDFLLFDCFALGDFDFFSSFGALALGFEDALCFEGGTFNS